MKAQRLNENGLSRFADWLESLKSGNTTTTPVSLLTDQAYIDPLGKEVEVAPAGFANRYEAAEYLHNTFTAAGLTDIEHDSGLWAWLSLFYFDAVCPKRADGSRKPGAIVRHIPEPGNFRRYYRHLLAGPYRIYRSHRDNPKRALGLLCQPLDSPGDLVEQLAARQELVTNRGIMELATRLYVDGKTLRQKRGAGGKGGGSARRLTDVLDQFDLTWDLYAATPVELAAIMPKEFEKFLA